MKLEVEFKSDRGEVRLVTYDTEARTAAFAGRVTPYQREGNTITVTTPNGPLSVTIENMAPAVGTISSYTTSDGDKGATRIVSVT